LRPGLIRVRLGHPIPTVGLVEAQVPQLKEEAARQIREMLGLP